MAILWNLLHLLLSVAAIVGGFAIAWFARGWGRLVGLLPIVLWFAETYEAGELDRHDFISLVVEKLEG